MFGYWKWYIWHFCGNEFCIRIRPVVLLNFLLSVKAAKEHGSEPTNQSPGNISQPIARWTAETKPEESSSSALSTGTSLPVVGEGEATHPWKFTNLYHNHSHRLQRRSNLKTSRYVYDYLEKKCLFFLHSNQTIVSLTVSTKKTSWTPLTPSFPTYSLLCYQQIRD